MLSNHFPTTFGHKLNWLVLSVLTVGSALIRHLMNIRFTYRKWLFHATVTFFVSCVLMFIFLANPAGFGGNSRAQTITGPHVTWSEVEPIFQQRCTPCHALHPTNPMVTSAPNGVMLETHSQIVRWKDRVKLRVVVLRNMPLANQTQMTDTERDRIGLWIDQGASSE